MSFEYLTQSKLYTMTTPTRFIIRSILYLLVTNSNLFAQNNTFLSCKILNKQFSKIIFSGKDDVIKDNEWTQEYTLDAATNRINYALNIQTPTLVRITYDDRYFEVFVESGDSLSLTFDGETYPNNISFEGKKTAVNHNTYLHEFTKKFVIYSNKNVINKMCVSMPLEFKTWMNTATDKKWLFLRQYNAEKQALFNPVFANFIRNEINYWAAFYLMSYSDEHQSLLSGQRFFIPNAYFDFLNETLINNDEAFSNGWYRKFLVKYYEFRQENIDFIYGLPSHQLIVKTTAPAVPFFNAVDGTQQIAAFTENTKLFLLDKLSYGGNDGVPTAYRLKVKTAEGLVGWIKTSNIVLEKSKKLNTNSLYIENIEINANIDMITGQTLFDSLKVYGDQDEDEAYPLYALPKNESLALLNVVSDKYHSYHNNGTLYAAPLTKILCTKGTIGWASTAGLRMNWKRTILSQQKNVVAARSLTLFNNLDYFFSGKALYYVAAIDIRERIAFEGKKTVEKNVAHYAANCPDEKMVQAVNDIFTKGVKRFFTDSTSMKVEKRVLSSRLASVNTQNDFHLANNETILSKNSSISSKKSVSQDSIALKPIVFPEVKYNISPAIITGKNSILKEKKLQILVFPDLVHYNSRMAEAKIIKGKSRKEHTFRMEIPLAETLYGFLLTDMDSIPIFLQADDEFIVTLNPKKELIFEGKNAINMFYLQAAYKNNKRFLERKIHNAYKLTDPNSFQTAMLSIKKEKLAFLMKFKSYEKLNRTFKTLIERDIDYFYSYHLMNFVTQKGNNFEIPKSFLENMEETGLQSDISLPSEYYRKFITQYIDYKIDRQKNDDLPIVKIISNNFSGKTDKYLEARFLSENPAAINDENNLEFAQFVSENPYPVINEMLKTTYKSSTVKKAGSEVINFDLLKKNGQKVKISDYKGKIVYIEFWNNKCDNWLKNSELRKKRQVEFKDKKVVFLYINVGENFINWKKSIKQVSPKGTHLSAIQDGLYTSRIDEAFGAQTLPSAVVLDAKGRILLNTTETTNEETALTKIRTALLQF